MVLPRVMILLSVMAELSKVNGMTTSFTTLSAPSPSGSPTSFRSLRGLSSSSDPRLDNGYKLIRDEHVVSHTGGFTTTSTPSSSSGAHKCAEHEISCGSNHKSASGTIKLHDVRKKYRNCENCTWLIQTRLPRITFQRFSTEGCCDFLFIHDGSNTSSPLIGKYSGNMLPLPVQASSDALFLQFISDYSVRLRGFELQWQSSTSNLCFFNGTHYPNGYILKLGCARLWCYGYTGDFYYAGYDYYNCRTCKAYLDPHISTYDSHWRTYSYQGCGNYSMTQCGNSYIPEAAVYATFKPCGGSYHVTCVDSVTFKNDEHTVVTLEYSGSTIISKVNGVYFSLSSIGPSAVQADGIIYPVYAWNTYNYYSSCISLYGSSGLLVVFCGSSWANSLYIWPDPSIGNKLQGLCGNITESRCDCFIWRDGNIECPWTRYPNEDFALSWLASGNSSCHHDDARVKRQSPQNMCEGNTTAEAIFRSRCTTATNRVPSRPREEVETLIDDCVFDLCHVENASDWFNAVEETVEDLVRSEVNTSNKCEDNDGWRGKCFGTLADLSGYTKCDAFVSKDSGCEEGQSCCVDCSLLTEVCNDTWPNSFATHDPCTRCDRKMGEIRPGSGCSCCKRCRQTQECKDRNGRCISDADPRWNTTWWQSRLDFTITDEWCIGDGCSCCSWTRRGNGLDNEDFEDY